MLNLLETLEELDKVSASVPLDRTNKTDEQGIPASLKVDDACGVSSFNITQASKSKLN